MFVLQSNDHVLKIGGSINFYVCAQRANGAGLHRLHTSALNTDIPNVT